MKKASVFIAILLILSTLISCKGQASSDETADTTDGSDLEETNAPSDTVMSDEEYFSDENYKPCLRFTVTSDVHITDTGYESREDLVQQMYELSYKIASSSKSAHKTLDAVVYVGDFTNTGSETSMKIVKAFTDKYKKAETENVFVLGNHEFNTDPSNTYDRFSRIMGNNCREHLIINGFHFIGVPLNESKTMDEDILTWLDGELAKATAEDPDMPVFVFQHKPPQSTVYGSFHCGETGINRILRRYPQVIDFCGHSHFPISDPRSIWQGNYTVLNTGTLYYYDMDISGIADCHIVPNGYTGDYSTSTSNTTIRTATQFYIIECDIAGSVRISGYDLGNDNKMVCRYYLRTPTDISTHKYTDARFVGGEKPVFNNDGKLLSVDSLRPNGFTISFPTATCADNVQHYRVEIFEGDKLIQSIYMLDMSVLGKDFKRMSKRYNGLDAGKSYTIKVTAVSSFTVLSDPLVADITLPANW